MTHYFAAEDSFNGYQLAIRLLREKLLREGAWQAMGPRDDNEKRIAEATCPKE